jgi:hypothetical protein
MEESIVSRRVPALRVYCGVQIVLGLAAPVLAWASDGPVDARLLALEVLGLIATAVAIGGLLERRREFVVLEALRLSGIAFVLVALWTRGAFGAGDPLFLAALVAPPLASIAAVACVAGRWFAGREPDDG